MPHFPHPLTWMDVDLFSDACHTLPQEPLNQVKTLGGSGADRTCAHGAVHVGGRFTLMDPGGFHVG